MVSSIVCLRSFHRAFLPFSPGAPVKAEGKTTRSHSSFRFSTPHSTQALKEGGHDDVLVLLDPWHWMDRWEDCIAVEGEDTYLKGEFMRDLSDAMFIVDREDYNKEKARLESQNQEGASVFSAPRHHEIVLACRRVIRPPQELRVAVEEVLLKWVDRDKDIERAKIGRAQREQEADQGEGVVDLDEGGDGRHLCPLLFNHKFRNTRRKQMGHVCSKLQRHADDHPTCDVTCTGCLSDPPGVEMNYSGHDRDDIKARYYTQRGTNMNECSHTYLYGAVHSRRVGAQRIEATTLWQVHKWNLKQASRRLGFKNHHTLYLAQLETINGLCETYRRLLGLSTQEGQWRPPYVDIMPARRNMQGRSLGWAVLIFFTFRFGWKDGAEMRRVRRNICGGACFGTWTGRRMREVARTRTWRRCALGSRR